MFKRLPPLQEIPTLVKRYGENQERGLGGDCKGSNLLDKGEKCSGHHKEHQRNDGMGGGGCLHTHDAVKMARKHVDKFFDYRKLDGQATHALMTCTIDIQVAVIQRSNRVSQRGEAWHMSRLVMSRIRK